MTFDRFSTAARSCFARARAVAVASGADRMGAAHLLAALCEERRCIGARVLARLGIEHSEVCPPPASPPDAGRAATDPVEFDEGARHALELSLRIAQRAGHDHIGTGHLLLGIARCGDASVETLRRRIADARDPDAVLDAIVRDWARFPGERGPWWKRVVGAVRRGGGSSRLA